jgi:hypothetical protein
MVSEVNGCSLSARSKSRTDQRFLRRQCIVVHRRCALGNVGDRKHGSRLASQIEARMDQFVQRENIALFRKRLLEATDPAARRVLLMLLAEEEAKADPFRSVGPGVGSTTGGSHDVRPAPGCARILTRPPSTGPR